MRIVAKDLTYVYNEKSAFATTALEDVSLTIEEGEFFGIIGHTGSGKSTFVQHLNALIPLCGGSLTVGEYNLKKYNKKEYRAISEAGEYDGICFERGKKVSYRRYSVRYGKAMKSDILQVTHHGANGGYLPLYRLIDPDICFWTCSDYAFYTNPQQLGIVEECDFNAFLRDDREDKLLGTRPRRHCCGGETLTACI